MNAEKKLLIKYTIENIIKNIRNSTYEQQYLKNVPIELSHHVLLDYYNLITNNISDQNTTIYILHIISREINASYSLIEKKLLLSLLPEFFIPFFTTDIDLTYPYLSRILTSIQSNILSDIPAIYIGEIFKKIIFYLFNDEEGQNRDPINKDLFEICQGFCFYNMKLNENENQLVGIICLNILLTEINYSFLNKNNFVNYIWEKLSFFLDSPNFYPKKHLLKYIYDFISNFKNPFRSYVNITIYKILEFIDNDNANIRKASLNILGLLISYYPSEIEPIKKSIIQLLKILINDLDENIRNKSIYIYNKISKRNTSSHSINPNKRKRNVFYFYDFSYENNLKKNETYSNKFPININNKRAMSRNPSYHSFNLFYDTSKRKNIKTDPINLKNNVDNITKYLVKNDNNNKNEKEKINYLRNSNKTSSNYINDNERFGFRKLLNMVKGQSDNKIRLDNNFSNLRNVVKKNNNGLLKIRKIKNEKNIKES